MDAKNLRGARAKSRGYVISGAWKSLQGLDLKTAASDSELHNKIEGRKRIR